MEIQRRLALPVRVRFDEADATGAYRASAHLRAMQDVAWAHSMSAGFDLAWYAARGRFWLVRCLELEILRPVGPGTVLTVTTEVVAMRRIWARRESEFVTPAGELAARGLADWVMTTREGAPSRILPELLDVFETPTRLEPAHVDPGSAPAGAAESRFQVRRHELDPMGHANNAVYVDWLDEAVSEAGGTSAVGAVPRRYRLEYLAPAAPGARAIATAWPDRHGWSCRLRTEKGTELLRSRIEVA